MIVVVDDDDDDDGFYLRGRKLRTWVYGCIWAQILQQSFLEKIL